jgi:predicted amidophosphoribosyltransferase
MYHSLIKPLLSDIKTFLLDVLFPISCLNCETEGKYICSKCIPTLAKTHQICIGCKKPSIAGLTHLKCFTAHMPEQLISFFDYKNDLVGKLIVKGKYYFQKDIFSELGEIVAEKIKKDFPEFFSPPNIGGVARQQGETGWYLQANNQSSTPDDDIFLNPNPLPLNPILTPIPLHSRRLRWRGFNQSEIFAESLASHLNLSCFNVLLRCKSTKIQKDLKREQRLKNIESAFAINPSVSPLLLRGEEIATSPLFSKACPEFIEWKGVRGSSFILIDDVTTTGATLLEATKVLKRNGAKKVICLTIARD